MNPSTTDPILRDCPPPEFAITDCHVHIGASDTGEIYYPELQLGEYESLMDASRIERACIFAPLRNDGYRAANAQLCRDAQRSDHRILPFARLGGRRIPLTEPAPWLLRRKIRRLVTGRPPDVDSAQGLEHFAGIKLLPHLDGVPGDDLIARINELRLPVLVHGGDFCGPAWIERALIRRLRGPVIIAHLGSFPCSEPHLTDAVRVARRHDNVYLDTSGAWHAEFIRYAVKRVPESIIFGSDAPLMHPWVAWQHVCSAVRDDATLENIGRLAANHVFGRIDPFSSMP